MAREYDLEIAAIGATLLSIEKVLDLPKLAAESVELEAAAGVPNLWDDPEAAQKITSKLSRVQSTIARLTGLRRRVEELPILFELAGAEPDGSALKDAEGELDSVVKAISELEVTTLLNGEYDDRDALITIRSEAGGVEAADKEQVTGQAIAGGEGWREDARHVAEHVGQRLRLLVFDAFAGDHRDRARGFGQRRAGFAGGQALGRLVAKIRPLRLILHTSDGLLRQCQRVHRGGLLGERRALTGRGHHYGQPLQLKTSRTLHCLRHLDPPHGPYRPANPLARKNRLQA